MKNKVKVKGRTGDQKPKPYIPHKILPRPKKDFTPEEGLGSLNFNLGEIELG